MRTILLIAALMAAPAVQADPAPFAVADGSGNGAYKWIWKDLTTACPTEKTGLVFSEVPSAGSVDNLSQLLNNKVNAAFTRADVLFWHNKTDIISQRVQTLISLYPEEVHIIALRNSKTQTQTVTPGGHFKKDVITVTTINFDTLSDLAGHKIGAFEGSVVSALTIQAATGINFQVVPYGQGPAVKTALDNGEVDAWITVGGAPLDNIEKLDGGVYKLIPIPKGVVSTLSEVFKPASLSYPKLSAEPVSTVSAEALLVTRNYKTPKMVESLSKLRECYYANLEELREATGSHPKWAVVDPAYQGKWTWYELPTDAPSASGTKAKAIPANGRKR